MPEGGAYGRGYPHLRELEESLEKCKVSLVDALFDIGLLIGEEFLGEATRPSKHENGTFSLGIPYGELRDVLRSLRRSLTHEYDVLGLVGEGAYGQIFLARRLASGQVVAIKKIRKGYQSIYALEERWVLSMDTRWLLRAQETFQDESHLHIVTEFMYGGTLSNLVHRADCPANICRAVPDADGARLLVESVIGFYMAETLLALEELHALGFAHRDVKPDNVLIDGRGHAKLADFGCVGRLDEAGRMIAPALVGTPDYIAPEVLGGENEWRQGKEVDLWGFGVSLFEMLTGELLFYSQSLMQTYSNIQNYASHLKLDEHAISDDARDLLSKLLCAPKDRIGIDAIKGHPFFSSIDWEHIRDAKPPFVPLICEDLREYLMDVEDREGERPSKDGHEEGRKLGLEGRLKMQLPFVGFSWPGLNLSIAPRNLIMPSRTQSTVLRAQHASNSASSVAVSRISLSGSMLPLKANADGDTDVVPLVDDDPRIAALVQELNDCELQLHSQLVVNEELNRKIETLRLANEGDRAKIGELVRKLEETLLTGSPLSSKRAADTSRDKKLLRQKEQEIQNLEQKLAQERLAREILAGEMERMREERRELLQELEKRGVRSDSESLMASASCQGTPVRELGTRSRRDTGGSLGLLRSFTGLERSPGQLKVSLEGELKILSRVEQRGKIKEEWQSYACLLCEDGLYGRSSRGKSRQLLSFECFALWAQPCRAKELPRIPAKKTLACFKIRWREHGNAPTSPPKGNESPLSASQIEATLVQEQRLLEGARRMLDAAASAEARTLIADQVQAMEGKIRRLQSRLDRIGLSDEHGPGGPLLESHQWRPVDGSQGGGGGECQVCCKDNIVTADCVGCVQCGLTCHKFCASEDIPSCGEIGALSTALPTYMMARSGEESKRWIRSINQARRMCGMHELYKL